MESMSFDVLIVGAGPAGLSASIRLKQLDPSLSVCVLEKGSEVGAHILSGCVLDPRSLNELIPDWKEKGAPLNTPAKDDHFLYLTQTKAWTLPTPPQMHNKGNYIISLGMLCRWLGEQAQAMGVEIYPGFAASEGLFDDQGQLIGVKTGDMGVGKDGQPTAQFQPGLAILAKQTLLAEGCRGSLSELLMARYQLRKGKQPQSYGIGLKEIWEITPEQSKPGSVTHTVGWPLDTDVYGGSFVYHMDQNKLAIGFVIGLDYRNPYLSPFEEFQRFKTHPAIRKLLEGGRRISYGARALNEGGWQSIPILTFPGGALIGCSAGFMNVPKIKGSHTAMKSGMLAAEGVVEFIKTGVNDYPDRIKKSWISDELFKVRNIRPGFHKGFWFGMVNAAVETYVFRGHAPWTLKYEADHLCIDTKQQHQPIAYPKPDGVISFDRLSSVFLCAIHHEENQPCHLKLKNPDLAIQYNYKIYDSPEQRYCPAGVYEIVLDGKEPRLQINSGNCIHCKTCDIKDPLQNIQWVTPQGGSGPTYGEM